MNMTINSPPKRGITSLVIAAAAVFSTLNPQLSTCFAQGSLTPPGAPAPTMKTLDQLDTHIDSAAGAKRIPISAPGFIFSAGSYYLTQNLSISDGSNGLYILSSNVDLDLNGYSIFSGSSPAAGTGILMNSNLHDIKIHNGHVTGNVSFSGSTFSGTGFQDGINYIDQNGNAKIPFNVIISELTVSGVLGVGINLGNTSTEVRNCVINTVSGAGIAADQVTDCTVWVSGGTAIFAGTVAHDCFGQSVGTAGAGIQGYQVMNSFGHAKNASSTADGIDAVNVENSTGSADGSGAGMDVTNSVGNSRGLSGSGTGIVAGTVSNSTGISTSGFGITATNLTNCIGTTTSGTIGLQATQTASFCRGTTGGGAGHTGLFAVIGIGCTGSAGAGGAATAVTNKFLMP